MNDTETTATHRPVPAVVDAARAQLFALVRRPAVWTIVAAMAVLNQVFAALIPYLSYLTSDTSGIRAGSTPEQLLLSTLPNQLVPNTLGGFPVFAGALALALGAIVVGSEHGWGVVKTLATQRPGRSALLAGQGLALLVVVTAIVLLLLVLGAVTSTAIALGEGQSAALPSAGHLLLGLGSGVLVLGTWAAIGGVLALALRSVALPVGLGVVWALGVENLVSAFATTMLSGLQPIRDLLPGVNAGSLVAAVSPERIGTAAPGVSDAVSGAHAVVTLGAYLVGAVVLAWWLQRSRDIT